MQINKGLFFNNPLFFLLFHKFKCMYNWFCCCFNINIDIDNFFLLTKEREEQNEKNTKKNKFNTRNLQA